MIVHSYYEFVRPNEITREDIEAIMGEPTVHPWQPSLETHRYRQCPSMEPQTQIGTWGTWACLFGVAIRDNSLCLTVHEDDYDAASFMSEARSALSKRLGIVWTNYDDEAES